jgi:hypothetical protein
VGAWPGIETALPWLLRRRKNYSDSGLFAQDLHRLFAAHAHRERRAFCDCSIATEFNAKR